jgi:hypothetical protein
LITAGHAAYQHVRRNLHLFCELLHLFASFREAIARRQFFEQLRMEQGLKLRDAP